MAFVVVDRGRARAYCFITRARLGKPLRAAADNPEAAIYMGIDVDAGASPRVRHRRRRSPRVAGGLVATYYPFQPYVGLDFVIIMYAGVVLGGMGSIAGAFWGGLTIGLVQQLSTLVLPFQLQNAAIFVVFLLIVLLRPRGPVRAQRGARVSGRPRGAARKPRRGDLLRSPLAYLAVGLVVRNEYYQLMLTLVPIWAMMGVAGTS